MQPIKKNKTIGRLNKGQKVPDGLSTGSDAPIDTMNVSTAADSINIKTQYGSIAMENQP
jgi:hypothetical protein